MFFKTNKCIFIGVRTKTFIMQSKNKIGAWAHMRPPPPLLSLLGTNFGMHTVFGSKALLHALL